MQVQKGSWRALVGGIVGAAPLFLVLFLLGVTDVKKETTVR